jgi:hypothetical protein
MNTACKLKRHGNIDQKRPDTMKWELLSRNLTLDQIDESLHAQAREAFIDGNAQGFLVWADGPCRLPFFIENWWQLQERGIYEASLLYAWVSPSLNHHLIPDSHIKELFDTADRGKLLEAGDPLPDGDSFMVYRGVAGTSRNRRVDGYSWTLNLLQASQFANRFDLPDPRIYQATVRRHEILAYADGSWRNEQEVICRPKGIQNRRLTHREIAAMAAEFNMQREQRD